MLFWCSLTPIVKSYENLSDKVNYVPPNKRSFCTMLRKNVSKSNNRSLFLIGFQIYLFAHIIISNYSSFHFITTHGRYLPGVVDFSSTINKTQFRMFVLSKPLIIMNFFPSYLRPEILKQEFLLNTVTSRH